VDADEQALIERCRAGDVGAFEPLVERYRQRVYRLAYNVLRDGEEAWDVAQEAFVRAWQNLGSFRGQSQFYTWLFRITVNVASDRVRARAAQGRAFGTERVEEEEWGRTLEDQGESPEDTASRAELRERIRQGLARLSEQHRTIIMLSDLEGLSYREIADVLDIPMGTVMSRLHNARKRLREALGPLVVLLLTLLATLGLAVAAEAEQVVRFGARLLYAGDGPPPAGTPTAPPPTDERISMVVPRLQKMFRYREYTWLERYRADAPLGTTHRWSVPGDRQLQLTPEGVHGGAVHFRVNLMRGSSRELVTNIQAKPGHPAIVGGPRHGEGVLIILIWANPSPGER
jgi:RNA polymerase sigma-70 factor (ECF subfamily)